MESLKEALKFFDKKILSYTQYIGILEEELNYTSDPNELRKIATIAYDLTSKYFPEEKDYFEEFV